MITWSLFWVFLILAYFGNTMKMKFNDATILQGTIFRFYGGFEIDVGRFFKPNGITPCLRGTMVAQ